MNLREALIRDQSKRMALHITDWIAEDPSRMEQLMDLFLNENFRITQRAAYPLIFIADLHPALFSPYLAQMIARLDDPVHDAVIRNTLRLFQQIDIPEELEGLLFDKCIHFLSSPKYPVAIRVFAMTVLGNLCVKYPELKSEILPLIRDILEISESPGMHSRGRKILARLGKTDQ